MSRVSQLFLFLVDRPVDRQPGASAASLVGNEQSTVPSNRDPLRLPVATGIHSHYNVNQFAFAVNRDGELWVASLGYTGGVSN